MRDSSGDHHSLFGGRVAHPGEEPVAGAGDEPGRVPAAEAVEPAAKGKRASATSKRIFLIENSPLTPSPADDSNPASRSIIVALRIAPIGFAESVPAKDGAEP